MLEGEEIRHYTCGSCFCEFFMRKDIEPIHCPGCGAKFDERMTVIRGEDGEYEELA